MLPNCEFAFELLTGHMRLNCMPTSYEVVGLYPPLELSEIVRVSKPTPEVNFWG